VDQAGTSVTALETTKSLAQVQEENAGKRRTTLSPVIEGHRTETDVAVRIDDAEKDSWLAIRR
jgi:hypothetical protein